MTYDRDALLLKGGWILILYFQSRKSSAQQNEDRKGGKERYNGKASL